ncbi:hypothetical protein MTR67_034794 [Solanum verrucosum]|uniref:Uncharacterized protein n=1 Tax=Solanum verrucosum TaxID=315347 RepID=A0AAF0U900_SOLVR|nr:hypothetical protein MTR67_034794 [Solanum verrucosum]
MDILCQRDMLLAEGKGEGLP